MLRFIEEIAMQMPALMTLASESAQHAATRQAHAAQNMVNADTPGYRPTDLAKFDPNMSAFLMRSTRPTHLMNTSAGRWQVVEDEGPLDPNGNGVDLETEVLRATEAQRSHSRALNVYQASLDILRASIGRGR